MPQTVFKRYEKKYIISGDTYAALKSCLESNTVPDKHGKSCICNIYYDTPDRRLIRASIEKPVYKEKLRLRSYGVPSDTSGCFLELKKKYKGVVFKRRISTEYGAAKAYMQENIPLPDTQICREIDYFKSFYGSLLPAAALFYERDAFYDRENSEIRVTFDGNILARGNDLELSSGIYGERILENGLYIMEVKTAGAMPLWIAKMLSEHKIYPTSFSKYGTAYKNGIIENHDKKIITLGGEYCA